jgi:hypothetical protein
MDKPTAKYRNDQELIKMKDFHRVTLNGLYDRHSELKRAGIKCEIVDDKAIMGTYKNEPFCVYYLKLGTSNGEFLSVLMTRWKGKDHRAKKPVEVLNG